MSETRKLLEELDATLLCCLNVGEPPSHVHLLREKIVKCRARIDAHRKTAEIAAVAGEPLTWGQKQDLIRYWSIRDVNECVNEIVRLSAVPAAPEGMKLVPMDSTDCIICKKKANPWTAQIVPEKGLICVYCCELQDAQETMPSAPAAPEGMVMENLKEIGWLLDVVATDRDVGNRNGLLDRAREKIAAMLAACGEGDGDVVMFKTPLRARFTPQPDITAYELALILPYFLNAPLFEEDLEKLGDAKRHLEIQP